jgi:hypothetical protein
MAECDWMILCDYAFPAMNGKLCMIGIFDTIFAPTVPSTHPQSAIGFSVFGEPGERVEAKIEIISPTAEVLVGVKLSFVLPDAGTAFGHVALLGLEFKAFGRHAIQMDLGDGTPPKTAWFTLRQIQAQE